MKPITFDYLVGDVRDVLRTISEQSIQCIMTSPPYWGLRDYGIPASIWGGDPECEHEWGEETIRKMSGGDAAGSTLGAASGGHAISPEGIQRSIDRSKYEASQGSHCHCGAWRGCLGMEPTPEMFIEHLVEVCRELWRVLRDDGTFFLNLGDSYCSQPAGNVTPSGFSQTRPSRKKHGVGPETVDLPAKDFGGLKPKDLVLMPHRVALRLQEDGWWVRSTIVWSKPNPMPESCTDRPTSSHEYIFLLTKKARYFYDVDAVREPAGEFHAGGKNNALDHPKTPDPKKKQDALGKNTYTGFNARYAANPVSGRNLRNVWHIATQPFPDAHFATFPERIPELCIKAGTSEWGCCPQCGAPWERVVEVTKAESHREPGSTWQSENDPRFKRGGAFTGRTSDTKGFQPTCECPPELEPIPCTVLDCFAGSGTTLQVARKLGRSSIGIDISDSYRELAMEREVLKNKDLFAFTDTTKWGGD